MKLVEFESNAEREMLEAAFFYEERQTKLGVAFLKRWRGRSGDWLSFLNRGLSLVKGFAVQW